MADTTYMTNAGLLKQAAGGIRGNQKVGLFTNTVTQSTAHVSADFTRPTWTGYVDKTLNAFPAATIVNGAAESKHAAVDFDFAGVSTPVTVKGQFTMDAADNTVTSVTIYENPDVVNNDGTLEISQAFRLTND